ncbi:MAG: hypothetical protein M0D53_01415 [Flavobacterium sp. JAD_PAG50586_2]|nr:MAG: hypothetical protein M0D53_01415 [Flavobacterium sp. JAD_PAG50586_2]
MKNNPHNAELFKNSVGIIKERTFSLEGLEPKEIPLEDVVFIELKQQINMLYNYIAGAGAFILLLFGLIIDFNPF